MSAVLPSSIDPRRALREGGRLDGRWPAAQCGRLAAAVERVLDDIGLSLTLNARGRAIALGGRITARVELICQRCLARFEWRIDDELDLIVYPDGAPAREEEGDVLELDDEGRIATGAWLEDEVLLRLPLIARHAEAAACDPGMIGLADRLRAEAEAARAAANPFAVLARGGGRNDDV
ncbi:MAG: hypothetical protein KatS3mg121_1302 [Gammaproteobacteria bacterium]|nr:MAG: hypothetical protein KatS3mg121_1302 [Gammaproteobacteria bacterium]